MKLNEAKQHCKLLSVIIPAYNVEKYLEKCVESVVNQTYKNIEIIIVDDGSRDSTPQLCDELASKYNNIKVIHQANKGLAQTRGVGFNASIGEYIAFLDSDDYINLNAYESAIKILEENDCDMVQFGIYDVDLDGQIVGKRRRENITLNSPKEAYRYFLTNKVEPWPVVDKVYKRSLFENIEWPKISMMEDYCISAQLFAKAQKFMSINEYLYYYVKNPASLCRNDDNNLKARNRTDIFAACDFVMNLTGQKFPQLLPEAFFREMNFTASFSRDFWPEVSEAIRRSYINMRSTLKACGIEFKILNSANRKELIHAHFMAYYPRFYKFYLKTRLKIHALTGI